jgi:predicted nuclease with TOPRIM domain
MSTSTLNYNFEERLNDFIIIEGTDLFNEESFKNILKELEYEFQQDTRVLSDIKELDEERLKRLNTNIKKFNDRFDSLNDSYYSCDYFNDGELKQLFTSLTRKAHKIENSIHKYLHQNSLFVATPDYIKEGLAKVSGEAIAEKLSPKN